MRSLPLSLWSLQKKKGGLLSPYKVPLGGDGESNAIEEESQKKREMFSRNFPRIGVGTDIEKIKGEIRSRRRGTPGLLHREKKEREELQKTHNEEKGEIIGGGRSFPREFSKEKKARCVTRVSRPRPKM